MIALDSGLGRPAMAACYLLEGQGSVAVIEAGTNHSVPRIQALLQARGWSLEQVSHVMVTHVHLDHAGGAGALMALCPRAQLVVHPRGACHMVAPERLEASVRQVYGDAVFDRDYGTLVPVSEHRVLALDDGASLSVGGRSLLFRHTPGHARHHFCIWDARTRGWFTGDTFGLCYRGFDGPQGPFIVPTTTPVQFDPPALQASIALLMARSPDWMYLTHFGRIAASARLASDLQAHIDGLVAIAQDCAQREHREAAMATAMMARFLGAAQAQEVGLDRTTMEALLANDVALNAQGLACWLDQQRR